MDVQRKLEILADAPPDLDRLAELARLHIPQKALPLLSDHRPSAHLLDARG